MNVKINNTPVHTLIDFGSNENFINHQIIWLVGLAVIPAIGSVSMVFSFLSSKINSNLDQPIG